MKHTFKISDESLNSYGFWVKSDGIDTANFSKNPVMLFNHNKESMPIGTWENLRVENGELLADAVFDMDDPLAKEVDRKVEKGIIRGASLGLKVKRFSDDPKLMKPGQQRATLIESELAEVSITAFPSNRNALKLWDTSGEVNLSIPPVPPKGVDIDTIIPKLNTNPKQNNMKEVMKKLGLSEDASQEAAIAAVESLQNEVTSLRKQLTTAFVKLGEATGAITDDNRERMLKLAEKDFDLALSFIEPGKKADPKKTDPPADTLRLSDLIKELKGEKTPDPYANFTFSDYMQKAPDKLELMREKDFEKFKKLYESEFGTKYQEG